ILIWVNVFTTLGMILAVLVMPVLFSLVFSLYLVFLCALLTGVIFNRRNIPGRVSPGDGQQPTPSARVDEQTGIRAVGSDLQPSLVPAHLDLPEQQRPRRPLLNWFVFLAILTLGGYIVGALWYQTRAQARFERLLCEGDGSVEIKSLLIEGQGLKSELDDPECV